MSPFEVALILAIVAPAGLVLWSAWRGDEREMLSPRVLFTLLILYYTVAGPLLFLFSDELTFLGIYMRPVLWKGWLASLVAYISFLAGYGRNRATKLAPVKIRSDDTAVLAVSFLFLVLSSYGMGYWIVKYGGGLSFLNPSFNAESADRAFEGFGAAFAVYNLQLINLSFGAAILLLLYVIDRRSALATLLFVAVLTFSILFFLKTGFRYRIAWMLIGLVSSYYLWRRKRPNLLLWLPVVPVFIGLMGLLGATRNYWGGLSMTRAENMGTTDFLVSGMGESGTFLTLSQAVDMVPEKFPHTWMDPLWITITYPIPRSVWPDKPNSDTLDTLVSIFGTNEAATAGQAVPYFGEWYIAFGWLGIIASSAIFGWLSRYLWAWLDRHDRDKFATVLYSVGLGFIFVAFSRGLLAQAALNFCFSVLPLMVIYRFLPKISLHIRGFWERAPGLPIPSGRGTGPGRRPPRK